MTLPQWFSSLLKSWFLVELWATIKLFGPIVLGIGLDQLQAWVSVLFCGHAPENAALILEAAGLAGSIINLTGPMVAMGIGVAMDTLAAQAWGAGSYKKIGVYLQRGILIHALVLLLVLGLWANLESILNLLHQPPCVVNYTVLYIHGFVFALPAIHFYYLTQKYIQAQGLVYPFIISGAVAMVVEILAHYVLMFVADLGILGAGIALCLTQYAELITILGVIWIRKLHKKTWGGWSWECLNDWGQYMKYSIPGVFITFAESGSYEVGMLVAGLAGSLQQSIYTVLESYVLTMFVVTYSLQSTASVRVGNAMGKGNPKRAKQIMFVVLCLALTWLAIIEVVTLSLRDYIPKMFTSDPTILHAITVHMFVGAVSIFCDTINGSLAGTIVGCGFQSIAIVFNVLCYWIVGTPLAVVLTLVVQLGALGYWIGQATGAFLLCCSYITITAALNWRKQSDLAKKVADLQEREQNSQDSKTSSDANTPGQHSSSNDATIPKPESARNSEIAHEDSSVKSKSSSMPGPDVSRNSALEPNANSSPHGGKGTNSQHSHSEVESKEKRKSVIRCGVGWKVIILRFLIVATCVILCAGSLVTSQMFVYHHQPCNATIADNETEVLQILSTSVPGRSVATSAMANVARLLSPTPTPTPTALMSNQQLLHFRG